MTSSIQIMIGGISREARRTDIFRESLAGIGRFDVELENQGNIYGGVFNSQDAVELKINNNSMMKGYVDDILPNVKDPAAVYRNLMQVLGRDYGQDLANLFITRDYGNTLTPPAIFQTSLIEAGSEIGWAASPSSFSPIPYKFKRQYLLDGFTEIAKLVNADFYVDDSKILRLFLTADAPSYQGSGVTLRSVAGATNNNILSLDKIGEKVGVDIKNYIHIEAGDIDDHWTEMNASDFNGSGTSSFVDDSSIFLAGCRSIKGTTLSQNPNVAYMYLLFPMYNHSVLDFSVVGNADCKVLIRHNCSTNRILDLYAKDDSGHTIYFRTDDAGANPPNVWQGINFPMGDDVEIIDGAEEGKWGASGGSPNFTWKLTRIGVVLSGDAYTANNFWIDGLKLSGITATAIADEGTPWGGHRKRMIPITRTDIKSQLQLDALATSELAHRKDPTQKLKITAIFQPNCKYAGQVVKVDAPSNGINSVNYRILGLHHIAEPRADLMRNHDAITEFDLVKHTASPGVQSTDPLRFRLSDNPTRTYIQRLEARLRALERG